MQCEICCRIYIKHTGRIYLNLKWAEGGRWHEQSWQGKRWKKDLTSPKPGIKRAGRLRGAYTSRQTHIKVSESQPLCLSTRAPLAFFPHLLSTQNWLSWACLAALVLLWPTRQTDSVPSHFTLSGLYLEHKSRDRPLCRPQIPGLNAPRAPHSGMCLLEADSGRWGACMYGGASSEIWKKWVHLTSQGSSDSKLPSVCQLLLWYTGGLAAPERRAPPWGGGLPACVCPWAHTWACVCVGGSRALGTESGSLLTPTVAATLAT